MSILTQKTLSKKISFKGIGIHTGKNVNMSILPAVPNSGIYFKRVDLKNNNIIYSNYSNVIETTLCTTLSNEFGVKVSTVEHLMGALYGIGIDINPDAVQMAAMNAWMGQQKLLLIALKMLA